MEKNRIFLRKKFGIYAFGNVESFWKRDYNCNINETLRVGIPIIDRISFERKFYDDARYSSEPGSRKKVRTFVRRFCFLRKRSASLLCRVCFPKEEFSDSPEVSKS